MFDIGWSELVVIGVVALVVIGPKELPGVLRTLGQMMAKVRRMAGEFRGQFDEAMREAGLAELRKEFNSLNEQARNVTSYNPIETARQELETAFKDGTTETPATPAAGSETPQVSLDVPPPEPPPPVTERDFASEVTPNPASEPAPAEAPAASAAQERRE